ncbi:MAG TPA: PrgI family protein [Candidatus Altiarchaeales archaeon]|nr:PrgI family protein [Candidatus Altiarchaeales archaeon]
MPYEIPTEIRYEERLLGPLTVKQSIYALIGGGILLYVWLYLGVDIIIKAFISVVIGGLLVGLIFFDLDTYLVNYVNFLTREKRGSWISPTASNLLGIRAIRANCVFLKNGNAVAVLKVRPIDFSMLTKDEQDVVIYNYTQFINSLDFPIQIVMRSVNLDLSDYLANLRRRIIERDDQLALVYYEHFEKYIKEYIEERKINDRLFYIIVPAVPSFDDKKVIRSLDVRCKVLIDLLHGAGIMAERLDNKQLLKFYASYFTPMFYVDEDYLSPVIMYKRMWGEVK